jgi:hypothetical protein
LTLFLTKLAHYLDDANHSVIWKLVLIVAVVSWVLFAKFTDRDIRARVGRSFRSYPPKYIALAFFFGAIMAEVLVGTFIQSVALADTKARLASVVTAGTINGTAIKNREALVHGLRQVRVVGGHHSHPTIKFEIELKTSVGPLDLELARDSSNSYEYWASNLAFHASYIGQVNIPMLDNYCSVVENCL